MDALWIVICVLTAFVVASLQIGSWLYPKEY
jgi:hypothetical protein